MDPGGASRCSRCWPSLLAWWAMRQSLPQLDGSSRPRNSLPRPPSSATRAASRSSPRDSRADLAFATGFAHAQDRFSRWISRGASPPASCRSCSAPSALGAGHAHAPLRLPRRRAPRDRGGARRRARVIEAYTRGVNAGLASLAQRVPGNTCCCAPAACVDAGGFGAGGALDVVAAAVQHADAVSVDRRRLERAAAARRRRGARTRAHHLRLRRTFRVGYA